MAALAGRGSAYAIGVVVQLAVAAAALPVVTRLVAPTAFGLIATALIVTNLLAVTLDLGLSRAVLRRYYHGEDGPQRARQLLSTTVLVTVATALLFDMSGPGWSRLFDDVHYGTELRLAVWGAAAVAGRNAVQSVLRATDRTGWYLGVMLLSTAGAQVLAVALLWRADGHPAAYLAGLAIGAAAAVLIGLVVARPLPPGLLADGLGGWALRFGLPVLVAEVSAVSLWFVDRVVIERLLNLEAVGRYQIAYTLGSVTLMMTMAASQAWAPLVHAAPPDERAAVTDATRRGFLEAAGYAAAAVALGSPLGLLLLAPSSYDPLGLVAVVAIVAVSALPLVNQQGAAHLLADSERTGALATRGVTAILANIALNMALIPRLGLTGAAVATLLTYVLHAVLLQRLVRQHPGPGETGGHRTVALVAVGAAAGALLPAAGPWLAVRLLGVGGFAVLLFRVGRRWVSLSRPATARRPRSSS